VAFQNKKYWTLFLEDKINNIIKLQHIDRSNPDVIAIRCSAESLDIKMTYFLLYIEYALVIAAVSALHRMARDRRLRGCRMRFAADPCGGITYYYYGVKYDVGNVTDTSQCRIQFHLRNILRLPHTRSSPRYMRNSIPCPSTGKYRSNRISAMMKVV
jgi:hypothetical protein